MLSSHRQKDARGMTALEAIIATLIFAVVVVMSFVLTFSATRSFNEKIRTSDLQTKGERCIKTMEDCITEAQTLATGDSQAQLQSSGTVTQTGTNTFFQSAITFQVPVTYNTP